MLLHETYWLSFRLKYVRQLDSWKVILLMLRRSDGVLSQQSIDRFNKVRLYARRNVRTWEVAPPLMSMQMTDEYVTERLRIISSGLGFIFDVNKVTNRDREGPKIKEGPQIKWLL